MRRIIRANLQEIVKVKTLEITVIKKKDWGGKEEGIVIIETEVAIEKEGGIIKKEERVIVKEGVVTKEENLIGENQKVGVRKEKEIRGAKAPKNERIV